MILQGRLARLLFVAACRVVHASDATGSPNVGQGTWEVELVPRYLNGDGIPVAFYDTVRRITWIADANLARTTGYSEDGLMSWSAAMTWVAGLNVFGVRGWRLPVLTDPSIVCDGFGARADCSFFPPPDSSDLAHLNQRVLGNVFGSGLPFNSGPFLNVMTTEHYWFGTEDAGLPEEAAWETYLQLGYQASRSSKDNLRYAWAVLDGDIVQRIPEPMSLTLVALAIALGLGLQRVARVRFTK